MNGIHFEHILISSSIGSCNQITNTTVDGHGHRYIYTHTHIQISCFIDKDQLMWFHLQSSLLGYTQKNLNWSNTCQNRPKVFQGSLLVQFRFNNQGVAKWTSLFSEQTTVWQELWPCHQPVPGNIRFCGICEPYSSKYLLFPSASCYLCFF